MERETAMKILKELHGKSLFAERTALETIIPELKESKNDKDERIRKCLIDFFEDWHENRSHCWGIAVTDILAWLEKQGESSKQRIKEFKEHPGMVKLYVHAAQKFFDNHPQSKMRAYIDNAAEWFVMSIYCKSVADFKQRFKADNLFGERIDCKQFLEQQFNITL